MMIKDVEVQKLKEIIAEVLEVEVEEVEMETDLVEELEADSMMALEIMATIEKEFGMKIPEDELPNFGSLKEISEVLDKLKVVQ
ncbi:acyl carrier protein [Bacillus sp. LL01]|uniref:acyl carrier protein n=1 Tax=Bacillus sp. LL01 TaxID=1665556 RepID=UPI00064D10DF|nr:acyl carrier protein [Bacillus sp. LL01]KMJ56145.1 acyl carrier protein [Bacillus sp. LL01]